MRITAEQKLSFEKQYGIPFNQIRENLRKIFKDNGVSKKNQEKWLSWSDFYYDFLDKDGKSLSEYGKHIFEHFKDRLGDPIKELWIDRFVID